MINWQNIAQAVSHYQTLGFEYVETPWAVDLLAAYETCEPHQAVSFDYNDTTVDAPRALVGSAEQGFIQLAREDQLPHVNYVSCSPCFRRETIDRLHQPWFMKVELFSRVSDEAMGKIVAREMANAARRFMETLAPDCKFRYVYLDSGNQVDVELNEIEVGSYGFREADGVGWWAYGTGIAEPRFTMAKEDTL